MAVIHIVVSLTGIRGLAKGNLEECWGRGEGGGGTWNWGLLLLTLIMGGGLSEGFRCSGKHKDTRDVDQLLNSRADMKEEIGVCRGTSSGHCKESVGNGVRGKSQDTRCQGIRVNIWNRTFLSHQPYKPGVDILEGSDGGTQIVTEAFFSCPETNGPH